MKNWKIGAVCFVTDVILHLIYGSHELLDTSEVSGMNNMIIRIFIWIALVFIKV